MATLALYTTPKGLDKVHMGVAGRVQGVASCPRGGSRKAGQIEKGALRPRSQALCSVSWTRLWEKHVHPAQLHTCVLLHREIVVPPSSLPSHEQTCNRSTGITRLAPKRTTQRLHGEG